VTIEAASGKGGSLGTGFIVREDGVVLTAAHVIKDADLIRVKFADGKTVKVDKIIEEDTDQDFALLKLERAGFPVMPLGDSDTVRQGETVYTLGAPRGLEFSASQGIVSANRGAHIQVDASISPGNSGGPVFNRRGQAIGVAVFKYDGESLNFALAINRVKPSLSRAAGSGANELWFVIASKSARKAQTYCFFNGTDISQANKWMREEAAKGLKVTNVAEGSQRFVVLMSESSEYGDQHVLTSSSFPDTKIRQKWDEGYYITNVLFDRKQWIVVMSKCDRYTNQAYSLEAEFPEAWVKAKWNEGFRITAVNGDGAKWLVVMTKGAGYTDQTYHRYSATPREWIREQRSKGYYITTVGTNGREWVAVLSRGTLYDDQAWWYGDAFPQTWIKNKWDQGWLVTYIR
jgi:hypothetical protein